MSLPLLILAAVLVLGGRMARGNEPTPEDRAFVEVTATSDTAYAGEPIRLRLRVGFDRDYFAEHAAPLFRRAMDVPIQVEAPWLRDLPGASMLPDPVTSPGDGAVTFVLGDAVAAAVRGPDLTRNGRDYTVLEVEQRFVAVQPGELVVPAPTLRFAHAERFEEDFLGGRTAIDRREIRVEGEAVDVWIQALPETNRPPTFDGVVGTYTAWTELEQPESDGDEDAPLRLRLRIAGEGNLTAREAPSFTLDGFHVYGAIDEGTSADGLRTVTYEIAPLDASIAAVPAIPFAFFDPTPPAGYRVAETDPIPLDGRTPRPVAAPADEAPAREGQPFPGWLLAMFVGAGLFGLLVAVLASRTAAPEVVREPRKPAVDSARRRTARTMVRRHVETPGPDHADAFAEFVASRLGCPPAAVITPDLATRLEAAGAPPDLAARAATTLERLVAARYTGHPTDPQPADTALLDALERTLS